ncbi:MAG: sulfatase-like hydrolase/transferase [Terriglobales bacterium]
MKLRAATGWVLFCCTLVLLPMCAGAAPRARPSKPAPPNVVIITIDTLRADHVGCYGYKNVRTPNFDFLAADGVRLERAYTPVPITLPAHTVMFTGTYPMQNGMRDFSGNKLNAQQPTLASVLQERGYATGAVVGAAVLDSRFGLNRGFDFYYDHFDFNRLLETNLDAMERPGNLVADEVLKWLAASHRKPFLLWMHLYDPHHPYRPPAPYAEEYKSQPYDGEIAFADAQVGRLLTFLRQKGLYDHTLIVLAGDHGEGLGEHGEKTHGFFIYNSTLHVPLIFKMPAGQRTLKQVAQPVSLVDLLPTVLDALNLPALKEVQGRSVLPLLTGKSKAPGSALYAESFLPRLHFNWSELRGLQTGNYRFIDAPKPELYDLSNDPRELNNLYEQRPALAAELGSRLRQVITTHTPGQELAEKTPLDPALMERLKSLGYAAFSGGGNSAISNKDLPDPKDRIQVYETFSEAMDDSQHGRHQEALAKLKAIAGIERNSLPVHYLLGQNYYRLRQFADAVREFERVVQLSPDYALGNFHLGLAYANAGQFDQAVAAFSKTLQLDPTNFSAAFNLGSAFMKLGRVPAAANAFQQSITINPDYADGHRALGEVLLYQGKVDEGIAELRNAVALAPQDRRTHLALAKALEAQGLHTEAQEERRKAQALAQQE